MGSLKWFIYNQKFVIYSTISHYVFTNWLNKIDKLVEGLRIMGFLNMKLTFWSTSTEYHFVVR